MEFKAAENLPDLPPKKLLFTGSTQFIKDRMKLLNKYLKLLILIYEAIECPILQRFLEIDTNFNPNYEYEGIDMNYAKNISENSVYFLEGDKLSKWLKKHARKGKNKAQLSGKNHHKEKEKIYQKFFSVRDLPKYFHS